MNFLSDIVKPRKTAANNITLQIREDCCSPSNNYYTSSFFDSNSEYTEQHTPTIAAKKKIVGQYVTVDTYSIWKCLQ
jgi:hypothetical protein